MGGSGREGGNIVKYGVVGVVVRRWTLVQVQSEHKYNYTYTGLEPDKPQGLKYTSYCAYSKIVATIMASFPQTSLRATKYPHTMYTCTIFAKT